MGKKLLIALILSTFLLAGPALAVKKVSRTGEQPTGERHKATGDKQGPVPDQATPPLPEHQGGPERQGNDDRENHRLQPPDQPPPGGDKDRFIDRDGDGINDNLKKPPEAIKKKKESDRQSRNPEKFRKDRRSR